MLEFLWPDDTRVKDKEGFAVWKVSGIRLELSSIGIF